MKQIKVTPEIAAFAAAAYDYLAERNSPAPDGAMRSLTLDRLRDADRQLSVEDRQLLGRLAGRT